MKDAVSVFEKLLVTSIIFVFTIVILVQIFINNDVLDTIKANEDGTAVSFEESSAYTPHSFIKYSLSDASKVSLLLNGESVDIDITSELKVFDGDVLEIKNPEDELVEFQVRNISTEISNPKTGSVYECSKGITYLFKVKIEEIS
ncbi:hypothetical protein GC105_05295 [Alkalibaculum sp. M08DMB]|uniref:Uncharacterized protein n=1 Tax=Alkalibaculum sporogenes TaxID=2655001 RepID=A0A6A7K741_9FIRM|nr:hypothetical protein [Alkalibaculum sporogenes]MPW25205.1 hypothetical protein [Alkalibaculum sporogenes]